MVANEGNAEVLTINNAVGTATIEIGVFAAADVVVGTSSLTLLGGTILAPTTGELDINGHWFSRDGGDQRPHHR